MSNYFVYIYYGQFLAFILLVFVLVWVLVIYLRTLSKYKKLKEREDFIGTRSEEEAERVILRAREESRKIISDSLKLSAEEKEKFAEVLEKSLEQVTASLAVDAKDLLDKEIRSFGENLVGELRDARAEMDSDIEKYKKEVVSGFELRLRSEIKDVVGKVVGGSLDEQKEEELIMESLEQAKKQIYGEGN